MNCGRFLREGMLVVLHKVVFLLFPDPALALILPLMQDGTPFASHILPGLLIQCMKLRGCAITAIVLVLITVFMAGCTTGPAPAATLTPTAVPGTPGSSQFPVTTIAPKTAGIDTVINVRFNDFACLDVQKELGRTYLYPDEKYTLSAASPGVSGVNVNVLFVDENDSLGIRQIKPAWDAVQKRWVYEGIVPLVQFNDITVPVEKTFTVKTQSKYYICVDDRKESGVNDVMLRVPVKLMRV
jgi:hypothetical protein